MGWACRTHTHRRRHQYCWSESLRLRLSPECFPSRGLIPRHNAGGRDDGGTDTETCHIACRGRSPHRGPRAPELHAGGQVFCCRASTTARHIRWCRWRENRDSAHRLVAISVCRAARFDSGRPPGPAISCRMFRRIYSRTWPRRMICRRTPSCRHHRPSGRSRKQATDSCRHRRS